MSAPTLTVEPYVGEVHGYRAIQFRFLVNGVESEPFSYTIKQDGTHAAACYLDGWLECAIDPEKMEAARRELRKP